jgi:hypothetical protein
MFMVLPYDFGFVGAELVSARVLPRVAHPSQHANAGAVRHSRPGLAVTQSELFSPLFKLSNVKLAIDHSPRPPSINLPP